MQYIFTKTERMKICGCRPRVYLTFLVIISVMFFFLQYYEIDLKRKSVSVSTLPKEHQILWTMSSKHKDYLTHSHNDSSKVIHIAKQVNAHGLPVLIALVNNAYLPFAYSWLCNTMYMGIHKQVLLIATDSSSRKKIRKDWPAIKVVSLANMNDISGPQEFSKAGYVRLMVRRTEIILSLLKEGVKMLLFEVDCVWFANPIPDCQKQIEGYDIVASAMSNRPGLVAAGFLYMIPTVQMIMFWDKLTWNLQKLGESIRSLPEDYFISDSDNDQTYFNRLIKDNYADIKVNVLPFNLLADGHWYKLSDEEQENMKPLIINNNWVSGNKSKIRRAKKFGHWFWKEKSGKCDKRLVNETLY